MATLLITRGTLKKGCIIASGTAWAKVRTMVDELGNTLMKATPSMPVEITGWKSLPIAGCQVIECLLEVCL